MNKCQILNEIKSYLGFSKDADFARFLGISPQTLSSWHRRNMYDIDILYAKCVDINPEYLISGRGDMLRKSPTKSQNYTHSPACDIGDNSSRDYIVPDSIRLDDDITRGLIDSIQSLTHAIEKLTDKLCDL